MVPDKYYHVQSECHWAVTADSVSVSESPSPISLGSISLLVFHLDADFPNFSINSEAKNLAVKW
jgi:hypothetical protein